MIKIKLLRLGKDLESQRNFAVFWLNYNGCPMEGDGELIILEEGQTHQDGRDVKYEV